MKSFSWEFLLDLAVLTGLPPESVRGMTVRAVLTLLEKKLELEKVRMEAMTASFGMPGMMPLGGK